MGGASWSHTIGAQIEPQRAPRPAAEEEPRLERGQARAPVGRRGFRNLHGGATGAGQAGGTQTWCR